MKFSSLDRNERIQKIQEQEFDLLVIGGGITGSGIALDATTRGMKTVLVEMQDFAAGTSSRSTKLVHGGLRYLKQFEVGVVAEVGKERAVVYENGPHVTIPEWMLLPIYSGGTYGKFSTSIGLRFYDFLAGVKTNERRTMLSVTETIMKEPLLKRKGLVGGGYYVEYRTDDARLTIEVVKRASELGAELLNYVKVVDFINETGKVIGAVVENMLTKQTFTIKAKKVINASGPWVETLLQKDRSKQGKTLQLTKGVHIVIDQSNFPLKQAVYFDAPDGRMIFAIPRAGKAYIGTTDTFYENDPIHPKMTIADRDYLLETIKFMFPDVTISYDIVESSWAGVRPLIYEDGKDPSEISRKDEIWVSDSGLVTIAGGKLTGYRKMSQQVLDKVAKSFEIDYGIKFDKCQTKDIRISGGEVGGSKNFHAYVKSQKVKGEAVGLDSNQALAIAKMYGSNASDVFALINGKQSEAMKYQLPLDIYGMLVYAIHFERTVTPVDFFMRRSGLILFNIDGAKAWQDGVINYMSDIFQWTETEKQQYTIELEEQLYAAQHPEE
ncbi:glycerol-3-phosphate dehydrogenase/oxidase [Peribacillus huizhouensis]|uniref:Glycerol-3-phosphate dehydrogenase n=1 Tax=Peribacillus huizhouensis TaxID=1501239 RepID=A0ABR6CRK9_9BACI|nr:FAD-dependent oxidoreductase [Peribacillus huizhouensis]MBA9027667.1 glycerol-3-phosphate dehydrogenase [Peribacillus huizhouensis]